MAFKKKEQKLEFPSVTGFETVPVKVSDPSLLAFGRYKARIEGTTPLLMQDASTAADDILNGMLGKPKAPKMARNIDQEFLRTLICIGTRPKTVEQAQSGKAEYGVPATWFKNLLVRTGHRVGFDMTTMRSAVFVHGGKGGLLPLEYKKGDPTVRARDVVNQHGSATVRVRAEFSWWAVDLVIDFNLRAISVEQLTAILKNGGVTNGVGQLRPFGKSSTGSYGCFDLVSASATVPKFETV